MILINVPIFAGRCQNASKYFFDIIGTSKIEETRKIKNGQPNISIIKATTNAMKTVSDFHKFFVGFL
ncbi:hypothetical protein [Candidatus Kryptobacter tengchongensis]|uniref:Uncharacterized protein n=1 Tax=Kryptobacter tengchongensis TaxID=1643429 RepID=A0A656D8M4_KRYT1|nr:hypothetical protein [Candidatus Kryptobacter tengchongensis]CUT02691.1 hypothetical protein JGI24_01170 [Candidatus Kryptobacter tengchongensis]